MEKSKRIVWIDYVKTFACLLVVIGHLLQSLQKSNLDQFQNISSYIIWFIYLFHMPLFMCMSGFLYCKKHKEFSMQSYKEFEIKKIINLSVPYFTFYLLYLGINILFSSSVNSPKGIDELIGVFNNPMAPYWFLYALLSIFLIIPIIEKICKNKKINVFIFLVILKVLSFFINTKVYFIDSFMKWAIYFYLGVFIKEVDKYDTKRKVINIFTMILYVMLSMFYYLVKSKMNKYVINFIDCIFAIGGIVAFVQIFKGIRNSKVLDTFKNYTFQIYLTHTIFAAGFRIVLLKIEISNYWIHFVMGMIVSIYIPVIMSIISDKIRYTNIFFYPLKTIEELRERKKKNERKEA